MANLILPVIIQTPEKIIFEGEVDGVSTENGKGILDVLPLHENFISIIQKEIVLHKGKEEKRIPADHAVLQIIDGKVLILVGMPPFSPENSHPPS